ncbi:hypothetical protein OPV22_015356 [Ensete ventricosum]|uniref:Uncharacterized protein n=1 Tax=Ensete ventricosum TaxID=4639 RepID=A0AAV8R3N6_ENSVE|nr:hypothetical protein OPV22_015356 [Ensete ventricosum]
MITMLMLLFTMLLNLFCILICTNDPTHQPLGCNPRSSTVACIVVIAFGSVPSPAMALGCGTTLKIIILGNRGKGASPNSSSSHLDLSYCGQDVIDQLFLDLTIRYVLKKFHEQYVATYGAFFVTKEILIGDAPVTLLVCIKIAEDWCASNSNIPYFGTSAKDDFNIDAAQLALNPDLDMEQ